MANRMRSAVLAVKEETTDGTLVVPTAAADFTVLRQGFTFQGAVQTVDSDELVDDIGASPSLITRESPTASIAKYFKHSGTEGVAPDYAEFIKSAMGSQTDNSTEYDTIAGAVAGTDAIRGKVIVDAGEGANFAEGQALLIKDGTNGYNIRNVYSVSTDDLNLNFNLAAAPGVGVDLGKAIHFAPVATGHPSLSLHLYQASSSSKFYQAIAGARTTNMTINFAANQLATIDFDLEGNKYYLNPIIITAANKYLNITDDGGTFVPVLTVGVYKSPIEFCRHMQTVINAAATDTFTVTYSNSTGKITIASDGVVMSLLWKTGANGSDNTDTHVGTTIGFSDTADDTGATTYTADAALTYSPAYTPALDAIDPFVVKDAELMIGPYDRYLTRNGPSVTVTISTPKTDIEDFSSDTGVGESDVLERTVSLTTTLTFTEHDIQAFDDMINNASTALMFNAGVKSGGNWVAGKCVNIYMPQAKIQSHIISESDGIVVVELEAKGFVSSDLKDVHINLL